MVLPVHACPSDSMHLCAEVVVLEEYHVFQIVLVPKFVSLQVRAFGFSCFGLRPLAF